MTATTSARLQLPDTVQAVIDRFFTAEVSTVGKDGTPVTWPVVVQYREDRGDFLLCTSIGNPGKVFNLRRNDRISLSYTDPTGSGLTNPPHVVVQGRATVEDEVRTDVTPFEKLWVEKVMGPQPASKIFSSNPIMRWYMDVYYMRVYVSVTPVRISWWPNGDHSQDLQTIEVFSNVG
jgi:nitroimidazol reductase NimA-like FMN-containing flavoprotein (pyridoxamine 5'-phosphate oxidase superfamily)